MAARFAANGAKRELFHFLFLIFSKFEAFKGTESFATPIVVKSN